MGGTILNLYVTMLVSLKHFGLFEAGTWMRLTRKTASLCGRTVSQFVEGQGSSSLKRPEVLTGIAERSTLKLLGEERRSFSPESQKNLDSTAPFATRDIAYPWTHPFPGPLVNVHIVVYLVRQNSCPRHWRNLDAASILEPLISCHAREICACKISGRGQIGLCSRHADATSKKKCCLSGPALRRFHLCIKKVSLKNACSCSRTGAKWAVRRPLTTLCTYRHSFHLIRCTLDGVPNSYKTGRDWYVCAQLSRYPLFPVSRFVR